MSGAEALDMAELLRRVAGYRPQAAPPADPRLWAATALVVAPEPPAAAGGVTPGEPSVAFIRRAVRASDTWSGHMALPGGKREPQDADAQATAVREAAEEVGVVLPAPAGRLDDVTGRVRAGTIATFVFGLEHRPRLRPDPAEVAAVLWVPVRALLSVEAAQRRRRGSDLLPAIRAGDDQIWGLTHRIVGSLARAIGVPLPPAPPG